MSAEMKVLRRKHIVSFYVGQTAKSFIESLKHVPSDATVDEVIDDYGDGIATIEFHEEIVEK